ncbi:hypothetical protein F0562_029214 [Nyssa sinensis]|uniref:Uncharacterized protein n=1 Tax=Nyssa sinensis TaxID=561372 RepID=A0A5J5B3G1_9ASTE|nr:hypothetical protein F0562_029214 [Nyssa sinensis]
MLFFLATACVVLLFSSSNSLAQEERGLPINALKALKALLNKFLPTGIPKGFKFRKDTFEEIKKVTDFVSKTAEEVYALFLSYSLCFVLLFSSSNSLAQEERGLPIKGLKALFNKIFQTGIPKGFKFSKDTIEKIKKYTDFVSKIVDEECKEKSNGQYCLPPNNKCFQCKGPICKALCSYDYFAKNFQKQCQICNN